MDITDTETRWNSVTFYKRSSMDITSQLQVDPVETDHKMMEEENQLHEYRSRINQYDHQVIHGKNWEYYKKIVNPYELVYTQKKYDLFPDSVCSLRPLSRSYFKMIEILHVTDFFKHYPFETIKTAHVCEGPGGFIEAIFDGATMNEKKINLSIAMTLKSKQTNIPGWKRASLFLKKNRNVKILYGEDGTGDIMKPENQQYFIDYATHSNYGGKIDLFTADGGFDFSEDYTKQEQMIFPLLVASTKIGLESLKRGGMFVLKIFDFYHKATTDLLYFLSCHFEEWTLYKPGMSRPCNPEHYFIGKGFTGCSDYVMDVMRLWCLSCEQHVIQSLLHEPYSNEFMEQITYMREKSFRLQTRYLERVFHMIHSNDDGLVEKYVKQNYETSREWCNYFQMPTFDSLMKTTEE
jgi:23S rRNA U2552 (ribose-2'-O)-methylase RlmE/FtsJ